MGKQIVEVSAEIVVSVTARTEIEDGLSVMEAQKHCRDVTQGIALRCVSDGTRGISAAVRGTLTIAMTTKV